MQYLFSAFESTFLPFSGKYFGLVAFSSVTQSVLKLQVKCDKFCVLLLSTIYGSITRYTSTNYSNLLHNLYFLTNPYQNKQNQDYKNESKIQHCEIKSKKTYSESRVIASNMSLFLVCQIIHTIIQKNPCQTFHWNFSLIIPCH